MAMKRTGGQKTDELLGRNGGGPEGLPHSIIVTPEGVEGEVPVAVPVNGTSDAEPNAEPRARAASATEGHGARRRPRAASRPPRRGRAGRAGARAGRRRA
jgi:DNA topoisomerase-6 subunit B